MFCKQMRTGSLICLLVRKFMCVSVSRGKPSIYFLLKIYFYCQVLLLDLRSTGHSDEITGPQRSTPTNFNKVL